MSSASKANQQTALALRDDRARIDLWRDPEWQRLWLSLQGKSWRSLAIVPAAKGAPKDFSLRIAVILSRTGMVHLGRPIQVADATNVPLGYLAQLLDEISRCTKDGDLILVALAPIAGSPLTPSIAQAADASLLCVMLERMKTAEMKKTVAQIGANRFVGSVIFRDEDLEPPPSQFPSSIPPSR